MGLRKHILIIAGSAVALVGGLALSGSSPWVMSLSLRSLSLRVVGGNPAHEATKQPMADQRTKKVYLADTGAPVTDLVDAPISSTKVKEHVFSKDLEGYPFAEPRGLGINQVTGDVYVSDAGVNPVAIEQFNVKNEFVSSTSLPAGSGETTFQLTVDNNAGDPEQGDVYIADVTDGVVYKFDPNAKGELTLDAITPKIPKEGEPTLGEPRGVAVDSSGNVYITNSGTVSEFSSTGTLLHENLLTELGGPRALAIDAAGDIYVAGETGSTEYSPAGACVTCKPLNSEFNTGITLDATGDVYISDFETGTVHEYDQTPAHAPIANPQLEVAHSIEGPGGLGVSNINRILYVAEREGGRAVKLFAPVEAKPATVTTGLATQVSGAVEALNGTVNPGGESTEYYFEYSTSACDFATHECGTRASEQSDVPLTGEADISISARLDNLTANTKYHYWAVVTREGETPEHGEEQTFTTGSPSSPPGSSPEGAAPASSAPASAPVFPLLTSIVPVGPPKVVAPKKLTRAQRLAKALATCARKPRKQRAGCRRLARRKYGR